MLTKTGYSQDSRQDLVLTFVDEGSSDDRASLRQYRSKAWNPELELYYIVKLFLCKRNLGCDPVSGVIFHQPLQASRDVDGSAHLLEYCSDLKRRQGAEPSWKACGTIWCLKDDGGVSRGSTSTTAAG